MVNSYILVTWPASKSCSSRWVLYWSISYFLQKWSISSRAISKESRMPTKYLMKLFWALITIVYARGFAILRVPPSFISGILSSPKNFMMPPKSPDSFSYFSFSSRSFSMFSQASANRLFMTLWRHIFHDSVFCHAGC